MPEVPGIDDGAAVNGPLEQIDNFREVAGRIFQLAAVAGELATS